MRAAANGADRDALASQPGKHMYRHGTTVEHHQGLIEDAAEGDKVADVGPLGEPALNKPHVDTKCRIA